MSAKDMRPEVFDALRRAVNVSKELEIHSVKHLRGRLIAEGYPAEDVDDALRHWAARVRETGPG